MSHVDGFLYIMECFGSYLVGVRLTQTLAFLPSP